MGLFGFLGNVASAAVKVAATPLAGVKDATATKDLFESIGEDIQDAGDEILP